jgi:hypothetical protein
MLLREGVATWLHNATEMHSIKLEALKRHQAASAAKVHGLEVPASLMLA